MSWLLVDDRFLENPKVIRAVILAGSEAIHLWLGLKAYVGQNLTDGFIPHDMLDEVRGPKNPKKRAAALGALKTVRLLDEVEGGVSLHNYLKWSESKVEVLDRRDKARQRKARSRDMSRRDTSSDSGVSPTPVTLSVTPGVTLPTPLHSDPLQSKPEGESTRQVDRFAASFAGPNPEDAWAFEQWQTAFGKAGATFDDRRARSLAERRLAGMTRQDVTDALSGAKFDPYVTGQKDGTPHDGVSFIFGDAERFEGFRDAGRRARVDGVRPLVRTGRNGPVQPSHGLTGAENAEVVK
jgi:hypothetical protein